jgi:immune inhibitor InhA-like protein
MPHCLPSWSSALRVASVLGILLLPAVVVRSAASYTSSSATVHAPAVSLGSQAPAPARPSAVAVACMGADNFETGNATRWTRTPSSWDVTDLPVPGPAAGTWYFTDSPIGLYESCLMDGCGWISKSAVFSEPIALEAGSGARIKFDHICITEHCDGTPCDSGILELSTDGGTNWDELARYDTATDAAWGDMIANPEDWRPVDFDISYYEGQTVLVRLRLESDQLLSLDGWYVDNFRIEGCTVTPTAQPSWGRVKALYR